MLKRRNLLFYLLTTISFLTMVLSLVGLSSPGPLRSSYGWLALTSGLTGILLVFYRSQIFRKK